MSLDSIWSCSTSGLISRLRLVPARPPAPSTDAGTAPALWQPAGEGERAGKQARHWAWLVLCSSALGHSYLSFSATTARAVTVTVVLGVVAVQHWLPTEDCSKNVTHLVSFSVYISPPQDTPFLESKDTETQRNEVPCPKSHCKFQSTGSSQSWWSTFGTWAWPAVPLTHSSLGEERCREVGEVTVVREKASHPLSNPTRIPADDFWALPIKMKKKWWLSNSNNKHLLFWAIWKGTHQVAHKDS